MFAATGRSLLAAAAMSLAACATQGDADGGNGLYDPFERVNRETFEFNVKVDEAIGKPIAIAYRKAVPRPVRDGIHNFTEHLISPITLVNDLLQGETKRAAKTLVRMLLNTTLGFAGLNDAAAELNLPGHKEGFGQTLAVWGIGPGPYLVLPFLGPSTTRHLAGKTANAVFDPAGYFLASGGYAWARFVGTALDAVDRRERLLEAVDGMKKTSLDFYAAARSSYWQARLAEIHNGRIPPFVPGDDDIDIDLDDDDPEANRDDLPPKRRSHDNRIAARVR